MFIYDNLLILLNFIFLIILVLISVAFFTLLERKVLGYIQIRKGPNKVGFLGILQPFSDALKLFSKESIYPLVSNFILYTISPIFGLVISLCLWLCVPFLTVFFNFNFSILFILCVSSLGVYSIMIAGWSSNSNFTLLGSLRSVAQSISYEVSLSLILLSLLFMVLSLNLEMFYLYQLNIWFIFLFFPIFMMWMVSLLAETNRTPFDFAEGESELVSGFNIEYSSGGFAMIFLAEYSSILMMSFLSSILFFGSNFFSIFFFIGVSLLSFSWLWIRGTLPRFRYDKLMGLAWKIYLPISLNLLIFYMSFKLFSLTLVL
uniref:NADH-ubiquinone oxidoreductase chain 1 n=1 Tax=Ptiliidae sp. BMNH 1274723 TaxID=1796536 RepID=A0A126TEG0_9COLE|nr:NADH dehydrogenase subunit 1 [Ptiliidae sp. BMNH 1274723]